MNLSPPPSDFTTTRYVYRFGGGVSDGEGRNKELLGGKGANLAEMASIGLPVPPGFTISTAMCARFYEEGERFPESLRAEVADGIAHIETVTGKRFGDAADPLLVSVRSGARVSMPGMMDTVLNLGLNDETVRGLAAISGDERFAWDSYRRFIQMYGDVVLGLDHGAFEEALEIAKEDKGVHLDTDLEARDWQRLVARYKELVEEQLGHPFPQDVHEQLWGAVGAVFGSWQSERAKVYRRLNNIPGDWGTAVNVQAMVFGNMGDTSATGVAFTRDPSTGERAYYGEYLINAQGEDVVAGIRTPQYLTRVAREKAGAKAPSMEESLPEVYADLARVFDLLERHYRDMQDIEFTVERGRLFMLQTRSGKRTAKAALKIAVDMAEEGLISQQEAVLRVDPSALGDRQGPAGFAGGRLRRRRVRRRHRRAPRRPRRESDLGPHRDQPRRHPRHARGARHPHRPRRHDQPRGGRRPRHGPPLRVRRGRHLDRLQGATDEGRRARGGRE
jgi:pyruvate, orthophosphate dikinase